MGKELGLAYMPYDLTWFSDLLLSFENIKLMFDIEI
jgi:hypothetical protein